MIYANSMIDEVMSNDSIKSSKTQIRNMGMASWMCLAVFVLGAYHLFSDGDFSFLMTLSSLTQAFGMIMLCIQFASAQSVGGVSMKAVQLHSSGDFIYRLAEFTALGASACALYLAYKQYGHTYEVEKDTFGNFGLTGGDRAQYGAAWIAAPALLLALLVHPSLNNAWWSDVAWTFALYMDVLAVMPQLFMFHKTGGAVAQNTAHYVFSLGFGRVLQLLFWAFSYHELSEHSHD